ncbi:Uncharacterized protein DAT39_007347, partial [Clarias magur]
SRLASVLAVYREPCLKTACCLQSVAMLRTILCLPTLRPHMASESYLKSSCC